DPRFFRSPVCIILRSNIAVHTGKTGWYSNWFIFLTSIINQNTQYMNSLQLKGNWNEIKGKLKQQYADLTDDDLMYAEGKEDELYGRLQKKLGKSKEEVQKLINEL